MSVAATEGPIQTVTRPLRLHQTLAYFSTFVALGLTVGSLGPTLPSIASQTSTSISEVSYLFTARSLGFVLGALRGGRLFDHFAGHRIMAAMLLVMALMMSLVALAPQLAVVLIAMLVLGAAESTLDVGANTLLVWVHGNRVGPLMNAMHSLFGVGALLAPIIVAQVTLLGYQPLSSYFLLGVIIVPLGAYLLTVPGPAGAQKIETEPSNTNNRLVFLLSLFLFLYVGAEIGFAGWIFTYAVEFKLAEATNAAYLTSSFWAALMIGRLITVPVATRFQSRTILIGSLLGALLSLILMLLDPRSFLSILAGTIGFGLSMGPIFPTTISFAATKMRISGRVTGKLVLGSSIGAMIVPFLVGQVFQPEYPRTLVIIVSVTLLLAFAVLGLCLKNRKDNSIRHHML